MARNLAQSLCAGHVAAEMFGAGGQYQAVTKPSTAATSARPPTAGPEPMITMGVGDGIWQMASLHPRDDGFGAGCRRSGRRRGRRWLSNCLILRARAEHLGCNVTGAQHAAPRAMFACVGCSLCSTHVGRLGGGVADSVLNLRGDSDQSLITGGPAHVHQNRTTPAVRSRAPRSIS